MEPRSRNGKILCNTHVHVAIEYLCLEPACKFSRGPLCPACFPQAHPNCSASNLVHQNHLTSNSGIFKDGFDKYELCEQLKTIFKSRVERFQTQLTERYTASKTCSNINEKGCDAVKQQVAQNQPHFVVDFESAREEGAMASKFVNSSDLKDEFAQVFARNQAALLHKTISNLAKGNIIINPENFRFHNNDLIGHNGLDIQLQENTFTIIAPEQFSNNGCVMYNKPLVEDALFKVTFVAVNANIGRIVLGLVDTPFYNDVIKSKFKENYNRPDGVWFTGGSKSNAFRGTYLTPASNTDGFKPGEVLYVEYKLGTFAIYNDERTVNLLCHKPKGQFPYYLYLSLGGPAIMITLEKLY